jgi:hypothetical protein
MTNPGGKGSIISLSLSPDEGVPNFGANDVNALAFRRGDVFPACEVWNIAEKILSPSGMLRSRRSSVAVIALSHS